MGRSTKDVEVSLHREVGDVEIEIKCLVELSYESHYRRAHTVTSDHADIGFLADGSEVTLTADEYEELQNFADDTRRAAQAEADDHAEAAAENAWDLRNDR